MSLVDSEPHIALVDRFHADLLSESLQASGALVAVVDTRGDLEVLAQGNAGPRTAHPARAALICYTSGTERMRKGVLLSEETLDHVMVGGHKLNAYAPSETFLSCLPLTHMFGFNHASSALRAGAKVVVCPEFTWMGEVVAAIANNRVTCACAVPFQLTRLVALDEFPTFDHLKRLWFGGAQIIAKDVVGALDRLPGLRIGNIYGLTEALRTSILWPEEIPSRLPSIGRPMPDVQVQLRDEDGRVITDPEGRGIAWIRGPNVMMGYWKRAEQTASVLADGWFCTNDIVRRSDDGYLSIDGRSKEVLNCGGEKLSPEVLERHIASACPVSDVAILAMKSDTDIDEIVAVIVCRAGAVVTLDDVQVACQRHVHSGFLPRRLIACDSLPWKPEGKLDRAALRRSIENAKGG